MASGDASLCVLGCLMAVCGCGTYGGEGNRMNGNEPADGATADLNQTSQTSQHRTCISQMETDVASAARVC